VARPLLSFVKAHAYGNDFLIADAADLPADADRAALARRACDRRHGIGADGLLVVSRGGNRARMSLLNADGSPSELSGNGLRCVGAWLASEGQLEPGVSLSIETDAGVKALTLLRGEGRRFTFRTAMGQPEDVKTVRLDIAGATVTAVTMRVGNPQCVVLGPATQERLSSIGSVLATHPHFPDGTNVELAEVLSAGHARILIWERGVGPTESSGTGTCAAAVAAVEHGGAARTLVVSAPGGDQLVEWEPDGLWLTGWAELVGRVDWWR
jgi:diaminopimelate epimerase